jgi:integrase
MFERPTKGDIDRALSTLMHDARHRCTALMLPAKQLSVGSSTPRVKTVNVMLSDQLIDLLRSYWKIDRRLFPTADPQRHITAWELEGVYRQTAEVAGLGKNVTVHTLWHCFATHLLEQVWRSG